MNGQQAVTIFEKTRPRLTRLAYRMLGSLSEAEDVVQDAYMRWHRTDREAVREPAAFLTRVVTRLCLDVKGSAR
ncbi:sigma factor, partial [Streptomyces scabiei]|uniref:sigma factor n=1 Tax=Streptomyces scabiei TaxID=1930 RepID=UPI0038F5FEA2